MMPKVGCMKYSNSKVMRLLGPPRSMRVPEQMNGLIRLFHIFDSTSEGEQVENTRRTATIHKTYDNLLHRVFIFERIKRPNSSRLLQAFEPLDERPKASVTHIQSAYCRSTYDNILGNCGLPWGVIVWR